MAQVKVQSAAPLSGPVVAPVTSPTTMPGPGVLNLQSSINAVVPAPTPGCLGPAAGFVDSAVSANPLASPQENMANPKEKTPMCLVNELARFNRIQPQYKLLNERGPAHAKIFTVQLTLGDQVWEAEGTSIKKAQHSTASKALAESTLPKPSPRSPKVDINSNPGSITPTVELNGLAMKRGEPAIYRPLDPKPMPNYRANYNFRGMFNQSEETFPHLYAGRLGTPQPLPSGKMLFPTKELALCPVHSPLPPAGDPPQSSENWPLAPALPRLTILLPFFAPCFLHLLLGETVRREKQKLW